MSSWSRLTAQALSCLHRSAHTQPLPEASHCSKIRTPFLRPYRICFLLPPGLTSPLPSRPSSLSLSLPRRVLSHTAFQFPDSAQGLCICCAFCPNALPLLLHHPQDSSQSSLFRGACGSGVPAVPGCLHGHSLPATRGFPGHALVFSSWYPPSLSL